MAQERNSPLTARSVLASAMLGMDPPELPVAQLVRLGGLFGISANRARVALSRMVASGEATSDGSGRYRLAGHLAERQTRQSVSRSGRTAPYAGEWWLAVVTASGDSADVRAARRRALALNRLAERQTRQSVSRSGRTAPYAGEWWLAVVTASGDSADVRAARRRALALNRLAELREGVWMRPANMAVRLDHHDDGAVELMRARPADAARLARSLWDLEGWARRARGLLEDLEALVPDNPGALGPGFELSAAVLRHLQADPLLPAELVPPTWPGSRLRARYDAWDAQYRTTLRTWSRAEPSR